MKEELQFRTKEFAYSCIAVLSGFNRADLYFVKSQLARSSTSVAANYRAVRRSQSTPSFIAKLSIVIEELDESLFWLELLQDHGYVHQEIPVLKMEGLELLKIFSKARRTARMKSKRD
jgi:four helix bundle protein